MHAERCTHTENSLRSEVVDALKMLVNFLSTLPRDLLNSDQRFVALNANATVALQALRDECSLSQIGFQLYRIHAEESNFDDPELLMLIKRISDIYRDARLLYSATQRLLRRLDANEEDHLRRLYSHSVSKYPQTPIISAAVLSPYGDTLDEIRAQHNMTFEVILSARYFQELLKKLLKHPDEFSFQISTLVRAMSTISSPKRYDKWKSNMPVISNVSVPDSSSALCKESERRSIRAVKQGNACVLTNRGQVVGVYKFDGLPALFVTSPFQTTGGDLVGRGWIVPSLATSSEIMHHAIHGDYLIDTESLRSSTWSIARDYNPLNEDHTLGSILKYGPADLADMVQQRGKEADNNSDRVVRLAGAKNLQFY